MTYCVDGVMMLLPICSSTQNEPVQKYVQEVITRDKAAQSLQPSFGNTQRIIQELRSSKEAKRKENRYRVVASHRPSCADPDGRVPIGAGSPGSEATFDASQKASGAVDGCSGCCRKFQLFDIVQEEEAAAGDSSLTAADPQVSKRA